MCVRTRGPPNGLRISRRRDAPSDAAGKARLKSLNHNRQYKTDGKYPLPRNATQAQNLSERG